MIKKFLGLPIEVSGNLFEPRIETAYWLKKIIKNFKDDLKKEGKALDIFCGTGCIGIALLKYVKNLKVDFIDINKKAIEQTKRNLKMNQISKKRYNLFVSDIFKNKKLKNKKYRFIFANPPYVARESLNEVQETVRAREDKISWYGGKEGLVIIKKFLKEAKNFLKKDGIIFMEIDPFQKEAIEKIAQNEQYKKCSFLKDQFKKIRLAKIEI